MEHHWKDPLFQAVMRLGLCISKHKHIVVGGMPMEITVEEDVPRFESLLHHEFSVEIHRVEL